MPLARGASERLRQVDPKPYLRHVIAGIAGPAVNRVDELLTWVVVDSLHGNAA
jgi:hypothetical protein